MMKTKRIYLPAGGLPPRSIPEPEDSLLHLRMRRALLCVMGLVYVVLFIMWMLGHVKIGFGTGGMLGLMGLLFPMASEHLLRPGKSRVWLWTFIVVGSSMLSYWTLLFWMFFPIILLYRQGYESVRDAHPRPRQTGS